MCLYLGYVHVYLNGIAAGPSRDREITSKSISRVGFGDIYGPGWDDGATTLFVTNVSVTLYVFLSVRVRKIIGRSEHFMTFLLWDDKGLMSSILHCVYTTTCLCRSLNILS